MKLSYTFLTFEKQAQNGRGIKRATSRTGEFLSGLVARSRALCACAAIALSTAAFPIAAQQAPNGTTSSLKTKLAKTTKVNLVEGTAWHRYKSVSVAPTLLSCPAVVRASDCGAMGHSINTVLVKALHKHGLRDSIPADLLVRPTVVNVNPANGFVNFIGLAAIGIPLDRGGSTFHVDMVDAHSLAIVGTFDAGGNPSLFNPLNGFRSLTRLGHANLMSARVADQFAGVIRELTNGISLP